MTIQSILLGFVISTLYGSLFHVWRGGSLGKLIFFLIMAWGGFWAGHFLSIQLDWHFLKIGPLHTGLATATSFLALAVAAFISASPEKPGIDKP